jgi:galactokinase
MTPEELAENFAASFGAPPVYRARAPGRVNLLGEHLDYNRGLALPMAIGLDAQVVIGLGQSGVIDLLAADLGERLSLAMDTLGGEAGRLRSRLPEWARYPAGVCWAWVQSGRRITGFSAAYTCQVPSGSGLSSSAAIEAALCWGLGGFFGEPLSGVELAGLCQTAENAVVGVVSGLMDPWVAAEGRAGHALLLDFAKLSARPIRLPMGVSVVAADSGVRRSLSASAYNQRVAECQQAVAELAALGQRLDSLRQIPPAEFKALAARLSEPVRQRAQHVVEEIERVRLGAACLETGDAGGFGELMNASHASLRDLYQVSGPELDFLVAAAQSLPGCYGSRLTGGGFGGSTVSLVEAERVEAFCAELGWQYEERTNCTATLSVCLAADGASGEWMSGAAGGA